MTRLYSLLAILAISYFGYHGIISSRGLFALLRLSHETSSAEVELASVTSERIELERKIKSLSSKSLDLDLLDEQSRKMLGYSRPDEVMILLEK